MAHDHPHGHSHGHHHGHSHGHHHHHGHGLAKRGDATKNIGFTLFLNLGFVVVELVGGVLTGSVAILADAVHDLGDCISLGLAWGLERWSEKRRTSEFSYGYGRFSLLAALTSGAVIAVGAVVVCAAAIPRIFEPAPTHGLGMLALATLGILVNGWAALRLSRGATMNERMLLWHYMEDILSWVAVFVGAIFIAWKNWTWIDPLLAVGISLFVLWNVLRNLRSTVKLFLQSVPEGFDEKSFLAEVRALPGVGEIHDLHIWSIDGNQHILSLHIGLVAAGGDVIAIKREVRAIASRLGEFHTTIEIEAAEEKCADKC